MKNYHPFLIAILVLLSLVGCDFSNPVSSEKENSGGAAPLFYEGQSIDSVQELLGEPDGRISSVDKTVLVYGGEYLEFQDGKWVDARADIKKRIRASRKDIASGNNGGKNQIDRFVAWFKSLFSSEDQGVLGDPLYRDLVVPGQITIVDFYATWCGPCKKLAPELDWLVKVHGVALRKVDIKNWDSAVAKKYNIRSVPNVRVFDKYGQMVGKSSSNAKEIKANILEAQRVQ